MTVVISDALVLGNQEFDTDNPIIGWHNLVTPSNLTSTIMADPDHPLANLANPSTYLRYQQIEEGEDLDFTVDLESGDEIVDYIGVARHNFGTQARTVHVYGSLQIAAYALLLHMDGIDGGLIFTDSSNNTKSVTSTGSVTIDDDEKKFGSGSALFGGTGNGLTVLYHQDFDLSNFNFTMDCWFNCQLSSGIAGNLLSLEGAWTLSKNTSDEISFTITTSAGTFTIDSTTLFSLSQNSGWNHAAVVRNGSLLMLFINGVMEASIAITGTTTVPSPSPNLIVGGDVNGFNSWNGWIDEVRITTNLAQWTSDFILPQQAYADFGEEQILPLINAFIPSNDSPMLVRFEPGFYRAITVVADAVDDFTEPAYAAVVYVGRLLVVERKIQVAFTPITMGRRSTVLSQRSERGHFLGRSIIGAWVETSANFRFLSPDWFRENMDPFLEASETTPFFFAWAPVSYPLEVGYAWAVDVPVPDIHDPIGIMGVTIQMQGIAA